MFRHPTLNGQRPTQLADQLQITKQSVNDLLGHLETAGYLTRQPDPTDRRARIIRLTAKGKRLEQTVRDNAQAADQQIAELLGTRLYTQLCAHSRNSPTVSLPPTSTERQARSPGDTDGLE